MENQQLNTYIQSARQSGLSDEQIRNELTKAGWQESVITACFSGLQPASLEKKEEGVLLTPLTSETIMNRIIEKMVPIVGAIFLISGIAYLIYTNAWIHIPLVGRLALGFILSTAIIGGSFSLSEKLRYFTDLGIGSGVLLLYGTLIYGSRTTDVATAVIPEVATLVTAFIFIAAVSYFASKRNSITVLILGMLGAYMTPFVIGTEHVWAQSISFNTYLIYFAAINVAVFLVGREISIRKIIPLNILSLCIGTSTLYALSYTKGVTQLAKQNFFTGDIFTAILLCVLCIFLTWSVLLSAKQFNEKDEGYLAVGYLAPILWFIYSIGKLDSISDNLEGFLYAILAASCFVGWHILRGYNTKFQHIGLYAAGLLAAFLAFFSFFPDLDIYTSIAIAYLSLIFAGIYFFNPTKWERLIAFGLVSLMGSILSVYHILDAHSAHETVYIVIALIPAMSSYFIAKRGKSELVPLFRLYSVFAVIVALMFILKDLLDYLDLNFLLFYFVPFIILGSMALFEKNSAAEQAHEFKSSVMRLMLIWFGFGHIPIFLTLLASIYPAPHTIYLFTHLNNPTDWVLIKGISAVIILFLGLLISRRLQTEQEQKRPSFILVIFGYVSLLLIGNYAIYAIMNDLAIPNTAGGARALVTTMWWAAIAIYMLVISSMRGVRYRSEKLLGMILLAITVAKILLYDIVTMGIQFKIIILIAIGALLLLFSYLAHTKGWLRDKES